MKIGIIGTGGFANCHANSLKRIGMDLAACYSPNKGRCEEFAKKHNAQAFSNPFEMINKKNIDVLYIVISPNCLDGTYEMAAIENGIPFLCEKPVGLQLNTINKVADKIKEKNLVSTSGFLLRYGKPAAQTREIIARNTPSIVRSSRMDITKEIAWHHKMESSQGMMMNAGIHTIDFMRFVFGEVEHVYATSSYGIIKEKFKDSDIYDSIASTLKFKNGMVANLSVSGVCIKEDAPQLDFLDVYGDEFRLVVDSIWDNGEIRYMEKDHQWNKLIQDKLDDRHDAKNRLFLEAAEKQDPSMIEDSYIDAVESCKVVMAINESAMTGKQIVIDEFGK